MKSVSDNPNFKKYYKYKTSNDRLVDRFPNVDWFCDNCGALLNIQYAFTDHARSFKCRQCGYRNRIGKHSIID